MLSCIEIIISIIILAKLTVDKDNYKYGSSRIAYMYYIIKNGVINQKYNACYCIRIEMCEYIHIYMYAHNVIFL